MAAIGGGPLAILRRAGTKPKLSQSKSVRPFAGYLPLSLTQTPPSPNTFFNQFFTVGCYTPGARCFSICLFNYQGEMLFST